MISRKMYDFNIGQKAVYPSHGVGTIENIQECAIQGDNAQDFYVLKIHSTGAKIMIPTVSAKTVGMRAIVSMPEVEKVFETLKSPSKKSSATWNRRFRALNEKLNTGDIIDIAEVLRDLSSLKSTKELSFGEKKMLERAKSMLISELSIAKDSELGTIERELNRILT